VIWTSWPARSRWGGVGHPDDIANGVLYLASDESRFMTGAELKLDGGISAQ
jgi:NAD(P)-dependent dehydrogenase (short-subunit alcohol dehydrogenase family)